MKEDLRKKSAIVLENFATRVCGKFDLCEIDVISCIVGFKQ